MVGNESGTTTGGRVLKPGAQASGGRPRLTPEVLKLGLVSFLTDLSSEAIFLVFAVFFTSVAMLARMKDQPGTPHPRKSVAANWRALSPGSKRFLVPAGVFALGYYSLGFLLLKAHSVGFSVTDTVLLGYGLFALINLALVWVSQAGVLWAVDPRGAFALATALALAAMAALLALKPAGPWPGA